MIILQLEYAGQISFFSTHFITFTKCLRTLCLNIFPIFFKKKFRVSQKCNFFYPTLVSGTSNCLFSAPELFTVIPCWQYLQWLHHAKGQQTENYLLKRFCHEILLLSLPMGTLAQNYFRIWFQTCGDSRDTVLKEEVKKIL